MAAIYMTLIEEGAKMQTTLKRCKRQKLNLLGTLRQYEGDRFHVHNESLTKNKPTPGGNRASAKQPTYQPII
jgi:hypothetical protein